MDANDHHSSFQNKPVMISQISNFRIFFIPGIRHNFQKMMRTLGIIPVVLIILFFSSCKKDDAITNPPPPPPPLTITIKSIKPPTASPGDTITIEGTNFSLTPSKDTVKFNGVVAQVIKASADTLYVIIPAGNTSGLVTVNGILDSGFLFTSTPITISITSVSPAWGKQGDTILIIGTHFNTNPAKDTVTINGVSALIQKASADTLTVIVPLTSTGAIIVNGITAPAPGFIYGPTVFVTTIVGPGSSGSTDGPDLLAQISPRGICFDKQGNLFVSEVSDIREIANGFVSTFAGNRITPGYLNGPNLNAEFGDLTNGGLAIDAQNNLYVTDSYNGRVRLISNGIVSDFTIAAGTLGDLNGPLSTATFFNPGPLAIDAQGNIYVAEPGVIRKISTDGIVSTFAGKLPTVDSPSVIFPGGNVTPSLDYPAGRDTAARFGNISSLTTDAQGNVYAGDLQCQCVKKITPSGAISVVGGVGFYNYRDSYNTISGMCTDATGNIYFSHKGAIFNITPQGVTSVVAGNATSYPSDANTFGFGFADGPAALALFNFPTGLACDAQGNLYVADTGNGRIRKITFH
jgi:serine/threonine-protein kinase